MGFVAYMVESHKYDKRTFNLLNLKDLLVHFETIASQFPKYKLANEYTANTLIDFHKNDGEINKELNSIISSINSSAYVLNDLYLLKISSENNIDIKDMNEKPTSLFIQSHFDQDSRASLSYFVLMLEDLGQY